MNWSEQTLEEGSIDNLETSNVDISMDEKRELLKPSRGYILSLSAVTVLTRLLNMNLETAIELRSQVFTKVKSLLCMYLCL
jgi:hypothetical protein